MDTEARSTISLHGKSLDSAFFMKRR